MFIFQAVKLNHFFFKLLPLLYLLSCVITDQRAACMAALSTCKMIDGIKQCPCCASPSIDANIGTNWPNRQLMFGRIHTEQQILSDVCSQVAI